MRLVRGLVIAFLIQACVATGAQADYTLESFDGCESAWNAGSYDAAGNLYIPCGAPSVIRVYDATGELSQTIPAAVAQANILDVAPSASGEYLYYTSSPAGQGADGANQVLRLVRQPNGEYLQDLWFADNYMKEGQAWAPQGRFVATDQSGNVYLSVGGFSGQDRAAWTIVKYEEDGTYVTNFGTREPTGSAAPTADSFDDGKFWDFNTGVAASPDGNDVYTTENGNNRVQHWQRQVNGTYVVVSKFGADTDAERAGLCATGSWIERFAAPYDVGLDAAGSIYIMNTSCRQVFKFSPDEQYIDDVYLNPGAPGCGVNNDCAHGFAVAQNGDVYVGEEAKAWVQEDDDVTCRSQVADIVGTPGDDPALDGTAAPNVIAGLEGEDTISALGGGDTVCGDGDYDYIDGGPGSDTLDGGAGGGIAEYTSSSGPVAVDLGANTAITGADTDTLVALADTTGSEFADDLTGSDASNSIYGIGGGDTITANNGNDFLDGGAGDDQIDAGPGFDRVFGGDDADALDTQDNAADTAIDCGPGVDTLTADPVDVPIATNCETIDDGTTPSAPDTTIVSGPGEGTTVTDTTPAFSFASSEANSTFECSIDAGAFTPCESPIEIGPLADGPHSFAVRAIDSEGNPDPTADARSFTVDAPDLPPPDTAIESGPAGGSTIADATPQFGFSSPEAGATFECRVDADPFDACESPLELGPLSNGSHTFEVRATDPDTGPDTTPATRTFTVDTDPPETTIDSGPAEGSVTDDTTPTFTFSSDEANSTFECSVDGTAHVACASPLEIGPLAQGSHTFEVRALDGAGNTDTTPASRSFEVLEIIDEAPETTFVSTPRKVIKTRKRQVTLRFGIASDDPNATFECLDSSGWQKCSSTTSFKVGRGKWEFEARAVDQAANVDPTPAYYSGTVKKKKKRRR